MTGKPGSEPRPPSRALTKTGGYLSGFTHTLQPYIGCRFSCPYCYVQGLGVHHFHQPKLPWGQYAHPRSGIHTLLAKELGSLQKRNHLERTSIFMSSSTDPYQSLERKWELTRGCLEAMITHPPKLLVIQTRSPLAERDFDLMAKLGERCWLSITLETDQDDIRKVVTPQCPSVEQRVDLLYAAKSAALNVQIAVSPTLPYSNLENFGPFLLDYAQRIVVDTYSSGDGQGGKRTARTAIPVLYEDADWPSWHSEDSAIQLFEWLYARAGNRVGWSQTGFTALAISDAMSVDVTTEVNESYTPN